MGVHVAGENKVNPNGLSSGVVRLMGRCESRQWREER
jgi:hypothetical protein